MISFVAEVNDVSSVVLLFDRYTIVGALLYKSHCLQGGSGPGTGGAFDYFCDNTVIGKRF